MNPIKINYRSNPYLTINNQNYDLQPTLQLLKGIQTTGNLRLAAKMCDYSYRKAWDILNLLENLLGLALVDKKRGKGTQLSELGEKLLDISNESDQLLSHHLSLASQQANNALNDLLSTSKPLIIMASDSEKLNSLRQQHLPIELHTEGSLQALAAYAEEKCQIAGFHIASGQQGQKQLSQYNRYLDPELDQFILLEQRQQGLISHPENPVHSLQQIIEQQLNFVNRQNGSGTRNLLDSLLLEQHITPKQLKGYYHEEHTHLAVASMIISRQADVGLGIQSVAHRLKLHFTPISNEFYFLVFKSISTQLPQFITELTHQNTPDILNYKDFITFLAGSS